MASPAMPTAAWSPTSRRGRSIVVLFTLLSINLFGDFMRTGHVTGLLLLASESLVVVLTRDPPSARGWSIARSTLR